MMEIKLSYAFGAMGILGAISSIYHLLSGNYMIISLVTLIACLICIGIALQKYKRPRR